MTRMVCSILSLAVPCLSSWTPSISLAWITSVANRSMRRIVRQTLPELTLTFTFDSWPILDRDFRAESRVQMNFHCSQIPRTGQASYDFPRGATCAGQLSTITSRGPSKNHFPIRLALPVTLVLSGLQNSILGAFCRLVTCQILPRQGKFGAPDMYPPGWSTLVVQTMIPSELHLDFPVAGSLLGSHYHTMKQLLGK